MLSKEELLCCLKRVKKHEEGKAYHTFEINVYNLVSDVIDYLENDNQPLKFEEFKEGMWVWDNDYKLYCLIDRIYSFNKFSVNYHFNTMQEFEENRFFRKQVEE